MELAFCQWTEFYYSALKARMNSDAMKTIRLKLKPLGIAVVLVILLFVTFKNSGEHSCRLNYQTEYEVLKSREYCNFPDLNPHGEEGEVTTAKDGSKINLLSVHTVIRHGDRYSVHTMPGYSPAKIRCNMTEELMQTIPEVKGYVETMKENLKNGARDAHQTFYGWEIFPDKESCGSGMLTPEGAIQHILNGKLFKQKYITKHSLLSAEDYTHQVMMKSTSYSRTYQSALALLYGFLPKLEISKLNIQRAFNTTLCTNDTGHTCYCPEVVPYVDVMTATFKQTSARVMKALRTEQVYSHLDDVFHFPPNKIPKLSHLMDVAMVHFCHNQFLPSYDSTCMQPWAVGNVYDILMENGANRVKEASMRRIARLKMHPLLVEIVERMVKQASGETTLKFVLYSAHDTTIEPLASLLNISDGQWFPYASRLVFELYEGETSQRKSHRRPLYIRVLLNGRVVTSRMPFCAKKMEDERLGLCSLDNLVKYVRKDSLREIGETNYRDACSVPINI